MTNYSQNNEQEIILNYFGDFKGRFLDIGAYDGVGFSDTRALLELGWSGVLVEPNPFNLVELIKNSRPFGTKATIFCAAVIPYKRYSQLFLDNREGRNWASSTVLECIAGNYDKEAPPVMVPSLEVSEFEPFGPFDFINIDAEWSDWAILGSFGPRVLESCRMLIIEAGGIQREEVKAGLERIGFKIHGATPENIIGAR